MKRTAALLIALSAAECSSLLAAAISLVSVSAAFAQTNSSSPLPEVTVEAPRQPTAEELAGDAVPDFIRTHAAPAAVSGQLARWGVARDPGICPLTAGLSPSFNEFVSARVLAVAATVGAPIQTGPCTHNVYIMFATDPQKALADMVKQDSRILGFHYPAQTRDLKRITRPIEGWYVTASHGAFGGESIDSAEPLLPAWYPRDISSQAQAPTGLAGSRLSSEISSGIINVLIVADANKTMGRPIGAIADYVAVLTLTQAFASQQCGTLPSITDLMLPNCDDREKLTGITAGDLAFLRALYKTDLESYLPLERSDIQSKMMGQFAGPLATSPDVSEAVAESAALAWFRLLDAGKYGESWSAASTLFQERVSQRGWQSKINRGRSALGPLHSRKLLWAVFAQAIPPPACWTDVRVSSCLAAPNGKYVIVKFSSYYSRKVIETVVAEKDSDGLWRVADYYIADGEAAFCTGSRVDCG